MKGVLPNRGNEAHAYVITFLYGGLRLPAFLEQQFGWPGLCKMIKTLQIKDTLIKTQSSCVFLICRSRFNQEKYRAVQSAQWKASHSIFPVFAAGKECC